MIDGNADNLVGRTGVVIGGIERPNVAEQMHLGSHLETLDVFGLDVRILDGP